MVIFVFCLNSERELLKENILFGEEVAEILEISRQAFYEHVKKGRIKPLKKTARSAIYLKEDVLLLKAELKEGRKKHVPYLFDDKNKRI